MHKTHRHLIVLTLSLASALTAAGIAAQEAGPGGHPGAAAQGKEDPHARHKAMMAKPAAPAKSADVDLKDLVLVDQDGRQVKFVSDVIGDRIVVMDFVYTTCTTVCPVLSAVFSQVQARLGERVGREVALVSLSVDPTRDTPQRLKAYSAKHQAGPGWV